MTEREHNAEAILRPVGGVEEIQVVGAVPEPVARMLDLPTTVRTVFLHPSVVTHVTSQREASRGDAEFVLQNLPAAILRPHYCGRDPRDPARYDLVHLVPPAGRPLVVAIKFVSAAAAHSQQDELWVSTGYPLSANFLDRKRWRESLRGVSENNP